MLSRLLKSRRAPAPLPSIPDGQRVYAIGDIHGRLDLLDDLIARIDADDARRAPAETTIIVLGDLVDRGPESAGVVERLAALAEDRGNLRFLKGNHEELFLSALDGDAKGLRMFARVGGRETALSYGIDPAAYERADFAQLHALLSAAVPERHATFLRDFEDIIRIGDYTFVHAGIRPGVALDEQSPRDLRWIREPFLSARETGGMIVHGHTITESPDEQAGRIGIDTGAYLHGILTALVLYGQERDFLQSTG